MIQGYKCHYCMLKIVRMSYVRSICHLDGWALAFQFHISHTLI